MKRGKQIAEEWWHFTLKDEPCPDRYFDFPVRSLTALKTCMCGQFDIRLPECPAALNGLDLSRDRSDELKRAEAER